MLLGQIDLSLCHLAVLTSMIIGEPECLNTNGPYLHPTVYKKSIEN